MAYYDIGEAFQKIEEEMIASMSRNLRRHLNTEEDEGLNYSMWQAEQLAALNEFKINNSKLFSGYFSTINEQIGEVLQKANDSGKMEQEAKILEAIREGWSTTKPDNHLQGAFFKLNDRKMKALINATKKDMAKAEHAMLRMTNDVYRKTIFNAQVFYNSGAGTLPQCVDMATKDFLSKGITCVEYANGARVGIDVYSRMALRTGQTRAYLQGESTKRDEWGVNTVIVNKRGVACPKCLKWVGKVYYDDVYGTTPVKDDKYPRLSTAIAGGLYHPNCKDIHTTYFEGISTKPKLMTQEQVDEANRVYALEQRQRYNERMIRKYKRLSEGSIDPENKAKYEAKLAEWQTEQRNFVKANSDVLKRWPELEKIFKLPDNLQYGSNQYDFSQDIDDTIKHEHTWVETITKQPTCEDPGEKIIKCSGCGEEKTKTIPAIGHQYWQQAIKAPTCTEEGYTYKTCSVCFHTEKWDIKPALGHDFGEWIITRLPTVNEYGRKQRICKRCGKVSYSTIPKLKSSAQPVAQATNAQAISSAKSFAEVETYMKKKYNVSIPPTIKKLDFESIKEGMAGIDKVFEEFPAAKKMFKGFGTGASGSTIMSTSYGGVINFNPATYATRASALYANRSTGGFHPKNNNPLGSGAHETGHLLERYLIEQGKGTVQDWQQCTYGESVVTEAVNNIQKRQHGAGQTVTSRTELIKNISRYACQDGSECLAEGVSDYILNGERASELSKEIWNVLKRRIK